MVSCRLLLCAGLRRFMSRPEKKPTQRCDDKHLRHPQHGQNCQPNRRLYLLDLFADDTHDSKAEED
jgi:hypothetical protein